MMKLSKVSAVVAVVLVAAILTGYQVLGTNMLSQERTWLDSYVDGEAWRPFAYRAFLPQILRGINAVTPTAAEAPFNRLGLRIAGYGMTGWEIKSGPQNKYPRDIVWLAALQFASLIGYALVGASLYRSLCRGQASRDWMIAPTLLLFLVPIICKGLGHIYDFTVVFFIVCLLRAMVSERHALYLFVFAVSCVNKETTIFMSVAYAAVFFRRIAFFRYAMMLAAQFAIFLVIYSLLRTAFAANPGIGLEVHLYEQIPYFEGHLSSVFASVIFCVASVVLLIFLTFRWRTKPQFLRRAAVMILPVLAVVLYGAAPGEVRNLYEIVPLLSMLILCSVESMYRIHWPRPATTFAG